MNTTKPLTSPPYAWGPHAARIGYEEPGHTRTVLGYDFTINPVVAAATLRRMRRVCYGTRTTESN